MAARRAVDEDFALRALSMSQHVIPGEGTAATASTSNADTTVSERLFVLSKRASDLVEAAVRAEKNVEAAELDFEECRTNVARQAEVLAAAQRSANEAQLVLQIRKGEYEDAVGAAQEAHEEYEGFFKAQTERMFANKMGPTSTSAPSTTTTTTPTLGRTSGGQASGSYIPYTGGTSGGSASADGSNKRPRLHLEPPRVLPFPRGRPPPPRMVSNGAIPAGPQANGSSGREAVQAEPASTMARTVSAPARSASRSTRSVSGASNSTSAAAAPRGGANEALPSAAGALSFSRSPSLPGTASPKPTGSSGSQAASLARQLLRAKTAGGTHNLSTSGAYPMASSSTAADGGATTATTASPRTSSAASASTSAAASQSTAAATNGPSSSSATGKGGRPSTRTSGRVSSASGTASQAQADAGDASGSGTGTGTEMGTATTKGATRGRSSRGRSSGRLEAARRAS